MIYYNIGKILVKIILNLLEKKGFVVSGPLGLYFEPFTSLKSFVFIIQRSPTN